MDQSNAVTERRNGTFIESTPERILAPKYHVELFTYNQIRLPQ